MKRMLGFALALLLGCAACAAPEAEDVRKTAEALAAPAYPEGIDVMDMEAQRARREENAVTADFLSGLEDFSFRTAAQLLQNGPEAACCSPLSLYFALSLAAAGAGGETQAQMLALLNAGDAARLADNCGRLYRLLYTDNEISKLKIADSLWLGDAIDGRSTEYKQAFLDTAARDFYASLFRVDFADADTAQKIAQWIADNTAGTLSRAPQTDPREFMRLINTVYFYDEWANRFAQEDTAPDTFHKADGSEVTCDFLNRSHGQGVFSRGENFTRAALPLKNGGGMVFVLPDEGTSARALAASPEALREAFRGGAEDFGAIAWKIPKFTCDTNFDLKAALMALGVKDAFGAAADFTGITDAPAYLSSAVQQTHIAVNEQGVEASAFTEFGFAGAAMAAGHAEMILDRPFLYGIESQGTLLFIGLCGAPVA